MSGSHVASGLEEANYSVITPYIIPPGLPKKVNVGDGFILDSATKLIGARPVAQFSNRASLTDEDIDRINATRCLVAIGANTLKDDFELAPRFTLETFERIKVPVVLMGVGHYGVAEVTRGLSPASVKLFSAFLDRFPYISVRCDASRAYVLAAMPGHEDAVLMTSCPVVYPVDGVDRNFQRKELYDTLVVTLTDRQFLEQQLVLMTAGKQLFPARRKILALHQDYGNAQLWKFAEQHGFEILRSPDCQDFIRLYAEADIHFGNRVHAHLKCLANGVVSFCTPFDLRQKYFSESLDFPLITQLPSPEFSSYDFQRALNRRDMAQPAMQQFLAALRQLIGL